MNLGGVALSRWRMVANQFGLGAGGRGRPERGGRRRGRPRGGLPRTFLLVLIAGGFVFAGLVQPFARLHALGASATEAGVTLALALGAAVAALVLFGIEEAVGALLLDPDLPLLRAAPLTPSAMLGIKLADAFPRTAIPLLTIALPAIVAYALHFPLPAWSVAMVPAGLVALWMITLGVGVALTLPILRVVPAERVRSLVSLLSSLVAPGIWVASWFVLPHFDDPSGPAQGMKELLTAPALAPVWSPATWLARALSAAAEQQAGRALLALVPLGIATALSCALTGWAAQALLEGAQARAVATAGHRKRGRLLRRGGAHDVHRAPADAMRAMVLRDSRLLLRDGAALGDAITHVVIWGVMPLLGLALRPVRAQEMLPVLLVSLVVGTGGHLAAKSVPLERNALAWARLAPVRSSRWIGSKLLSGLMLSAPVAALYGLALSIGFRYPSGQLPQLTILALSALGLSLSTGLWLGTTFGDREWTQPQLALSLSGRLLSIAVLLAQLIVWVAVVTLERTLSGVLPPGFGLWGPPALALGLAVLPLAATSSRLGGDSLFR